MGMDSQLDLKARPATSDVLRNSVEVIVIDDGTIHEMVMRGHGYE